MRHVLFVVQEKVARMALASKTHVKHRWVMLLSMIHSTRQAIRSLEKEKDFRQIDLKVKECQVRFFLHSLPSEQRNSRRQEML